MDISLDSRPCTLGPSINLRTEKHGDDDVAACDIPLDGIMLQDAELNALLEDKHAHNALYEKRSGKPDRPLFPLIETLALSGKYEGNVALIFGPNQVDLELEGVTVSKIRLKRLEGGLTQMSCSISCSENTESFIGKLTGRMNGNLNVELDIGEPIEAKAKSAQADLPINTFGEGEQGTKPKGKRSKKGNGSEARH